KGDAAVEPEPEHGATHAPGDIRELHRQPEMAEGHHHAPVHHVLQQSDRNVVAALAQQAHRAASVAGTRHHSTSPSTCRRVACRRAIAARWAVVVVAGRSNTSVMPARCSKSTKEL